MAGASYGGVIWFDPGAAASDAALTAVEREVGVQLPRAYVELLKASNGGTLKYMVRLPDGTEAAFNDWFRAAEPDDDGYGTVIGEWRALQDAYFRDQLPPLCVPIARTGSEDDALLLDLTPDRYGSVVAWVSGVPPGWGLPTEDALHRLAPSLTKFLDQLYIDESELDDVRRWWPDDAAGWLSSRGR